jgi:hypothetical protein
VELPITAQTPLWVPFLTLGLGYFGSLLRETLRDWRLGNRERERREAEALVRAEERDATRADRLASFQRETLLHLQESLHSFQRSTWKAALEDRSAYVETGVWGRNLVDEELARRLQELQMELTKLEASVDDEGIRRLVESARIASTGVNVFAQSPADQTQQLQHLMDSLIDANLRIGELLRRL